MVWGAVCYRGVLAIEGAFGAMGAQYNTRQSCMEPVSSFDATSIQTFLTCDELSLSAWVKTMKFSSVEWTGTQDRLF